MTTPSDTFTPTAASVWEDVLEVRRRLCRLASLDRGFLADQDVDGLVGAVGQVARVVPVVQQGSIAQVVDRGMAESYGCTSAMAHLQAKLRLRRSGGDSAGGCGGRPSLQRIRSS